MVIIRAARLLAWDQASHCGKKEKKIGVGEKKKIGEQSEPRGSPGRRNGGGPSGGPRFLPTAEPGPRLLAYENRLSRATSRVRLREQSLTRVFHCKV